MGEGDFTRPWVGAAASESGIGHRVMGRTERPLGHKGIPGRQHSHDGIHLTDLQRFLPRHIRENGGQTLAEHTFAGTRRAYEQHIVAARRRDLQRPLYVFLPQHVLEIRHDGVLTGGHPQRFFFQRRLPVQSCRQLRHRMDGIHRRPPGKRRLRGVLRRDKQRLNPLPLGGKRHGQHAGNGTDGAVQTQLPKESAGGFRPTDASAGRENTQ